MLCLRLSLMPHPDSILIAIEQERLSPTRAHETEKTALAHCEFNLLDVFHTPSAPQTEGVELLVCI